MSSKRCRGNDENSKLLSTRNDLLNSDNSTLINYDILTVNAEFSNNKLLKEARTLINWLHVRQGHRNYAEIIDHFRDGVYDKLITEGGPVTGQNVTAEELLRLKRVSYKFSAKHFCCTDCWMVKARAKNKVKKTTHPNHHQPFREGHMDIIGPFPRGHGGTSHILLYIDDDSNYGLVDCLAATGANLHASDLKIPLQKWRLHATRNGWSMEKINMDSDPIFLAQEFQQLLLNLDIDWEYAPPGQKWQNGLSERFNQTIKNTVKTNLRASGLPWHYFPFAFRDAIDIDRTIVKKRYQSDPIYKGKSPYEIVRQRKWATRKPVFGQLIIARHPDFEKLGIQDDHGRKCAYLCIDNDDHTHESWVLLHLLTKQIVISKDCRIVPNTYAWNSENIIEAKAAPIGSDLSKPPVLNSAKQPATERQLAFLDNIVQVSELPEQTICGIVQNLVTYYDKHFSLWDPTVLPLANRLPVDEVASSTTEILVFNVKQKSSTLRYERVLTTEELDEAYSAKPESDDTLLLYAANIASAAAQRSKLVDMMDGRGPEIQYIPRTMQEATEGINKERYSLAIKAEIDSIIKEGVFSKPQNQLPDGQLCVDTKWVFDIKTNSNNQLERYKARLTCRGFLQRIIDHYRETFSPTAYIESIRLILFMVTNHNFSEFVFDVKVAFLKGTMDQEVWVEYPEGFPGWSPKSKQFVRLIMALYGTKQAARIFWLHLRDKLFKLGYTPTVSDPCTWHRWHEGKLSLLCTHVDDIPGCSQDPTERDRINKELSEYYELTSKYSISKILGMLVKRNNNGDTIIYNDAYFEEVAAELGIPQQTPTTRTQLVPTEQSHKRVTIKYTPNITGKTPKELHGKYRKLIGCLLWSSRMWRPETVNHVRELSAFTANPSFEHWEGAVSILQKCRKTPYIGLKFSKSTETSATDLKFSILCYVDADWAREWDRRSVSGWCIAIHHETVIAKSLRSGVWPKYNYLVFRSKKQASHVADSSQSAEMYAGNEACKDMIFLSNLLQELNIFGNSIVAPMLNDSSATVVAINNSKIPPAQRHNAIKFQSLLSYVSQKDIQLLLVKGEDNTADMFTKILDTQTSNKHASSITGIAEVDSAEQ
jgi:transposase InsO family protein